MWLLFWITNIVDNIIWDPTWRKTNSEFLQPFFGTCIHPDMKHSISDIKKAISSAIKVKPTLQCNKAKDGTVQLYQIYLCWQNHIQTVELSKTL